MGDSRGYKLDCGSLSEQGWRNLLSMIKPPQSISRGGLQLSMGHRASQECRFRTSRAEQETSEPQVWVFIRRPLGSGILWGHNCKAQIRRRFSRAAGAQTSLGMTRTGSVTVAPGQTGNAPRWQGCRPDTDTSILLRFSALFTHFLRGNCVSSRGYSQLPPSSQRVCLCQACELPLPHTSSSPRGAITSLCKEGTYDTFIFPRTS